jgi:ribonuclease HI
MNELTPYYVLTAKTSRTDRIGSWQFVLRPADGAEPIEVADVEPDIWGERLELLTVVRALESLDQPSRVTLIGCTHYVEQGIQYGLAEWRENGWRWEWFGQMVPVRDADLWQRMDRILKIHRVECGWRRLDAGHNALASPHSEGCASDEPCSARLSIGACVRYCADQLAYLVACVDRKRLVRGAIGFSS